MIKVNVTFLRSAKLRCLTLIYVFFFQPEARGPEATCVKRESSGATGHVSASLSTGTATSDRTVRTEVTNGTAVSTATV
jgi:hypothetical protein